MPRNAPWTEGEARAAVQEYFALVQAEQEGRSVNKRDVYRKLSTRFPSRPWKAFELKFQNISAILYENRLPYCSGLKPRFNYQSLLRLLVLDRLHKSPLPAVEPHEILFAKLRALASKGVIPVRRRGTGRFGLAIEEALGIQQNCDKAADFMGIELKTKSDATLQTLFSRTPSRFLEDGDKASMFRRHSYIDEKRQRKALYTSFSSRPDSLGFSLRVRGASIVVRRRGKDVLEYDAELIEEALLSKHTQTAYVVVKASRSGTREECALRSVQYCKWPSILRFQRLVEDGEVFLDLTMSQRLMAW